MELYFTQRERSPHGDSGPAARQQPATSEGQHGLGRQEARRHLRAKYGGGHGGELFDPKFRTVADKIFSKSGTRLAPYAGVPTFLAAPYSPLDADKPDFGDLQVAMVGVPMDLGVTNRPGSRFGPRALRTIERIGPYNHVLECAPTYRPAGSPTSATCRSRSRYRLEHQP